MAVTSSAAWSRGSSAAAPITYHLSPVTWRRGQSAIEHAALITIMAATLIGMSVYVKRALAGKWRAAADTFGQGKQYEPGVTTVTTEH